MLGAPSILRFRVEFGAAVFKIPRRIKQPACNPFNKTNGLVYFPRLLDKMRRHARGELRDDLLTMLQYIDADEGRG